MRFENWEAPLAEFIESRRSVPFNWSTNDCALFACDAALAITGVDLAADFRGKYDSALSAARLMRDFAGGGVAELADKIAQQFGIEEVPVLFARRGDVVLLPSGHDGPALGIVGMDGWFCLAVGNGLVSIPLDQCLKAWRI